MRILFCARREAEIARDHGGRVVAHGDPRLGGLRAGIHALLTPAAVDGEREPAVGQLAGLPYAGPG